MTGVLGGILGIVGSLGEGVLSFFSKKDDNKVKLEMQRLALEQMDKETEREKIASEAKIKTASLELESDTIKSNAELLAATYKHDSALTGIRGLVRPILTLLLVIATVIMWFTTEDKTIATNVSGAVIEMTIAAVLWWFGGRAVNKAVGK